MCNFCSFISDGHGNVFYFDAELRKKIINKELDYESADSHSSIADYFFKQGSFHISINKLLENADDKVNKYEYNPLTRVFTVDMLNTLDDSEYVRKFCENLEYKTIVPELIIKPIINPFKDRACTEATEGDIKLLKEWNSGRASVRNSVGASVRNSVRASVRDSVRASVRDSVGDSVWDSVRASVGDSVWDSIRDSVGDSVWAYYSSFFNPLEWKGIKHESKINPFQSGIDLWEKGLVPTFDGKKWMLFGKDAKIVFEITKEKLSKI